MKYKILSSAIFIIILSSVFLFSCKKDKGDPVLIFVTPETINLVANANSNIVFKVEMSSDNGLSRLIVEAQFDLSVPYTVKDTSIIGKSSTVYVQYHVPDTTSGTSVYIKFSAYDSDGNLARVSRRLIVQGSGSYLTETSGHIFYSKYSGKADAFSITTLSPLFTMISPDSLLHIADFDTIPDSTLMNKWHSPAGFKFVVFNGFDYANATMETAKSAYNAGTKFDLISGLQSNDIIITQIPAATPTYAVFKIVGVIDSPGVENDRYEFNVKK